MTTGGYLIKIHPKPSDSGRGVPLKGQRIFPKNAPLCLFFLGWGGLGESVPTRTPLLSTAASQRNVSMSPWPWAPRCRPNSWSFFFGTNESTDAGPLLPVTSYAYSLHVYKWAQLPSSLVGAHPKNRRVVLTFDTLKVFFEWMETNRKWVDWARKPVEVACKWQHWRIIQIVIYPTLTSVVCWAGGVSKFLFFTLYLGKISYLTDTFADRLTQHTTQPWSEFHYFAPIA